MREARATRTKPKYTRPRKLERDPRSGLSPAAVTTVDTSPAPHTTQICTHSGRRRQITRSRAEGDGTTPLPPSRRVRTGPQWLKCAVSAANEARHAINQYRLYAGSTSVQMDRGLRRRPHPPPVPSAHIELLSPKEPHRSSHHLARAYDRPGRHSTCHLRH